MIPPLLLTDRVQPIQADGTLFGLVVRDGPAPDQTAFLTEPEHTLQLGYIVYPAGHEIPRHTHRPVVRTITGTAEVLVVKEGRCELDVYDDGAALVETVTLAAGDVVLLLGGGHAFRMIEDTVLMEVKQGPYPGPDEKQHF